MARRKERGIKQCRYQIPLTSTTETLHHQLASHFHLSAPERIPCLYRYYDTFDSRLGLAHVQLRLETVGERHRLRLYDRQNPSQSYTRELADGLRFASDLPPGPIRDRLIPLTYPRALLPLADVRFTRHVYRCLNKEEKTVARILIREGIDTHDPNNGKEASIPGLLEVRPVRGYVNTFRKLRDFLDQQHVFNELKGSFLSLALEALDEKKDLHSLKFRVELDPEMQAQEAIKKIGRHLLNAMQLNLPGLLRDLDSEFLHDFRIAIRRTRTMLGQLKTLFPTGVREEFRADFKWLGSVTSPVRDLDVYLLSFDDVDSWIPPELKVELGELRSFLCSRQQRAHKSLVRELKSERYERLVQNWGAYLDSPPLDPPPTEEACLPVLEVASRRIWKAYRKVYREGTFILHNPGVPAEALHELRIHCKKLRYLLEMFGSLYPSREIRRLLKALKRLQNNLGDFQDSEVQQQKIQRYAGRMMESGVASTHTILAMGRLEAHLEEMQHQARLSFDERFEEFIQPAYRKLFARLFSS